LAIIIAVALQQYEEHNNLSHWISGVTQSYNKRIRHWVVVPLTLLQFTVFLILL